MNPHTMLEYIQLHHEALHKHWNGGVKMEDKVQELVANCFYKHLGVQSGSETQIREINYSTPHPGRGAKPTADVNLAHNRNKTMYDASKTDLPYNKRFTTSNRQTFYCVEIKAESPKARDIPQGGYPEAVKDDVKKITGLGYGELTHNPVAAASNVARFWVLVFGCHDAQGPGVFGSIKADSAYWTAIKTFTSTYGTANRNFVLAIKEFLGRRNQNGIFVLSASRAADARTHNMPV